MLKIGKKREKITILLGAGANLDFIKDMSSENLTQELCDRKRWEKIKNLWKNIIKEINSPTLMNTGWLIDGINNDENIKLLDKIINDIKKISLVPNFENIIYILDKVCLYLHDFPLGKPSKYTEDIDEILIGFLNSYLTPKKRKKLEEEWSKNTWVWTSFMAREVIADIVFECWNNMEPHDKSEGILMNKNFLKYVFKCYKQVNIYSLNYDPLIYEVCKSLKEDKYNIITGFEDDSVFKADSFLNGENSVAFPHGHIAFVPQEIKSKRINRENFYTVRFEKEYKNAQQNRLSSLINEYSNFHSVQSKTDRRLIFNTSIVTGLGYSKVDSLFRNPFRTYLHKFAIDTYDSNCILIVGYSFGDHHINTFLFNNDIMDKTQVVTKIDRNEIDENNPYYKYPTENVYTNGFKSFIGHFLNNGEIKCSS